MMYKHLVVGYDGQERSQKAVQAAAELAEALSATLHVVTAVPKDRFRDLDGGPERRAVDVESSKTRLERLKENLSYENVTTAAVKGTPADVLLDETNRVGADLIVVGNKNVQGIGRVLGNVADQVAKKAPCAMLIVNTA
jgi:nucleotide-binding universal stress UspA family protein